LLQDVSRDAEVEVANLAERRVALGGYPSEIALTVRLRPPVVAREGGPALEERRLPVDDRRVLDAELVGRLHVSCNELRVRHVGLQRQVGPAVLGVTAGVGRED